MGQKRQGVKRAEGPGRRGRPLPGRGEAAGETPASLFRLVAGVRRLGAAGLSLRRTRLGALAAFALVDALVLLGAGRVGAALFLAAAALLVGHRLSPGKGPGDVRRMRCKGRAA